MPILAKDERLDWQRQLLAGEFPQDIADAIETYRELRERSDWRSTRFVECLGEAAVVLVDKYMEENTKLRSRVAFCEDILRRYESDD